MIKNEMQPFFLAEISLLITFEIAKSQREAKQRKT